LVCLTEELPGAVEVVVQLAKTRQVKASTKVSVRAMIIKHFSLSDGHLVSLKSGQIDLL
jgi:hypothetical protein